MILRSVLVKRSISTPASYLQVLFLKAWHLVSIRMGEAGASGKVTLDVVCLYRRTLFNLFLSLHSLYSYRLRMHCALSCWYITDTFSCCVLGHLNILGAFHLDVGPQASFLPKVRTQHLQMSRVTTSVFKDSLFFLHARENITIPGTHQEQIQLWTGGVSCLILEYNIS